jgi:hypothetical protein
MLLNFYFYPDVQKTPGEIGGGYVWDFMESFKKYIESELAATKTIGPPNSEVLILCLN